jgi:hypothetical protein
MAGLDPAIHAFCCDQALRPPNVIASPAKRGEAIHFSPPTPVPLCFAPASAPRNINAPASPLTATPLSAGAKKGRDEETAFRSRTKKLSR